MIDESPLVEEYRRLEHIIYHLAYRIDILNITFKVCGEEAPMIKQQLTGCLQAQCDYWQQLDRIERQLTGSITFVLTQIGAPYTLHTDGYVYIHQ